MRSDAILFDLYGTLLTYGDMTAAWSEWLTTLHQWPEDLGLDLDLTELDPDALPVRLRREGDTESDKAADFRRAVVPRQWTEGIEHVTVSSLCDLPVLIART